MKGLVKPALVALMLMTTVFTSWSFDFESEGIYYNKTGDATVSVTYGQSTYNTYKGDVVIPSTVQDESGATYTVTAIDVWAFMYCVRLTSVQLPSTLVSIGLNAFNSCTQLESIVLPEGLEVIGDDAFYFCSKLPSVTIPNTVKSIGEEAFYNCSALTTVVIGSGVTSIGSDAFGCDAYTPLASVTCLATTPPAMGASDCFYTTTYNMATLRVPAASVDAYRSTDWWNLFVNVEGLAPESVPGDVNGDGRVSIDDVTALINLLLDDNATVEGDPDVNGDTRVNIDDVTALINQLLTN